MAGQIAGFNPQQQANIAAAQAAGFASVPAWQAAGSPEAAAVPAAAAAEFASSLAQPIAGTFPAAFYLESRAGLTSFASSGPLTRGERSDLWASARPLNPSRRGFTGGPRRWRI